MFDEYAEGVSDGGARGFGSRQEEINYCGHQVLVDELSGLVVLLLWAQLRSQLILLIHYFRNDITVNIPGFKSLVPLLVVRSVCALKVISKILKSIR